MKKILLLAISFLAIWHSFAQTFPSERPLSVVYLKKDMTVHILSPENIRYVDISTHKVHGDIPVANLLRLKMSDSCASAFSAVLTIVGEKNISQFSLVYDMGRSDSLFKSSLDVGASDMRPISLPDVALSESEAKGYALTMFRKPSSGGSVRAKGYGMKAVMNNIASLGDYVFLDISYLNKTNLKIDIDEIRFSIDDKKLIRASNSQSIELIPEYIFSRVSSFRKYYRNVFVFRKFTFPGNKVLNITLSEKQVSGRTISFAIRYGDLLDADTLEE
ncbi:conjugative transposon protein TraN [Pedobacter miscanthi]|uniref:Conjugative transposon protein TraN n=1 Tax=Pedobacter miscanthi TaxID=2259170 RepID=A0A366L5B1_9SPHI|nr:conjugative transposon protein TraN [Pedobacter miscanthi]RBQ08970.1 conjugative transposon protein TraN [Pedobacter miscanthi]